MDTWIHRDGLCGSFGWAHERGHQPPTTNCPPPRHLVPAGFFWENCVTEHLFFPVLPWRGGGLVGGSPRASHGRSTAGYIRARLHHVPAGGSLRGNIFFVKAALRDRPNGPSTTNHQPPPTATNRQPPAATNRQPPPTATNRHPPPPGGTAVARAHKRRSAQPGLDGRWGCVACPALAPPSPPPHGPCDARHLWTHLRAMAVRGLSGAPIAALSLSPRACPPPLSTPPPRPPCPPLK